MESHQPICKHPVAFSGDECFESKLYEGGFVFDLYHLKGRAGNSIADEVIGAWSEKKSLRWSRGREPL
jgi:hypothetical protein